MSAGGGLSRRQRRRLRKESSEGAAGQGGDSPDSATSRESGSPKEKDRSQVADQTWNSWMQQQKGKIMSFPHGNGLKLSARRCLRHEALQSQQHSRNGVESDRTGGNLALRVRPTVGRAYPPALQNCTFKLSPLSSLPSPTCLYITGGRPVFQMDPRLQPSLATLASSAHAAVSPLPSTTRAGPEGAGMQALQAEPPPPGSSPAPSRAPPAWADYETVFTNNKVGHVSLRRVPVPGWRARGLMSVPGCRRPAFYSNRRRGWRASTRRRCSASSSR